MVISPARARNSFPRRYRSATFAFSYSAITPCISVSSVAPGIVGGQVGGVGEPDRDRNGPARPGPGPRRRRRGRAGPGTTPARTSRPRRRRAARPARPVQACAGLTVVDVLAGQLVADDRRVLAQHLRLGADRAAFGLPFRGHPRWCARGSAVRRPQGPGRAGPGGAAGTRPGGIGHRSTAAARRARTGPGRPDRSSSRGGPPAGLAPDRHPAGRVPARSGQPSSLTPDRGGHALLRRSVVLHRRHRRPRLACALACASCALSPISPKITAAD